MRLLTPTKCILNGVIVLDGTSQNNTSGCSQEHLEFEEEGEIIYGELTYKHVVSPFVSGRIAVEVFCKAWLYMCTFILYREKST